MAIRGVVHVGGLQSLFLGFVWFLTCFTQHFFATLLHNFFMASIRFGWSVQTKALNELSKDVKTDKNFNEDVTIAVVIAI